MTTVAVPSGIPIYSTELRPLPDRLNQICPASVLSPEAFAATFLLFAQCLVDAKIKSGHKLYVVLIICCPLLMILAAVLVFLSLGNVLPFGSYDAKNIFTFVCIALVFGIGIGFLFFLGSKNRAYIRHIGLNLETACQTMNAKDPLGRWSWSKEVQIHRYFMSRRTTVYYCFTVYYLPHAMMTAPQHSNVFFTMGSDNVAAPPVHTLNDNAHPSELESKGVEGSRPSTPTLRQRTPQSNTVANHLDMSD